VPYEQIMADRTVKAKPTSVDAVVGGEITQADWTDQAQNRTEQE
jgi:hypothetical protein